MVLGNVLFLWIQKNAANPLSPWKVGEFFPCHIVPSNLKDGKEREREKNKSHHNKTKQKISTNSRIKENNKSNGCFCITLFEVAVVSANFHIIKISALFLVFSHHVSYIYNFCVPFSLKREVTLDEQLGERGQCETNWKPNTE